MEKKELACNHELDVNESVTPKEEVLMDMEQVPAEEPQETVVINKKKVNAEEIGSEDSFYFKDRESGTVVYCPNYGNSKIALIFTVGGRIGEIDFGEFDPDKTDKFNEKAEYIYKFDSFDDFWLQLAEDLTVDFKVQELREDLEMYRMLSKVM